MNGNNVNDYKTEPDPKARLQLYHQQMKKSDETGTNMGLNNLSEQAQKNTDRESNFNGNEPPNDELMENRQGRPKKLTNARQRKAKDMNVEHHERPQPDIIYPGNSEDYKREYDLNNIYSLHLLRKEYEELVEQRMSGSNNRQYEPVKYEFVEDISVWESKRPWDYEVKGVLRDVFKLDQFRLIQKPVINAILSRKDVFCCMPTGGGKSLIFQVPAVKDSGFTMVFMPIISLIMD